MIKNHGSLKHLDDSKDSNDCNNLINLQNLESKKTQNLENLQNINHKNKIHSQNNNSQSHKNTKIQKIATEFFSALFENIGEDYAREGLEKTPARFVNELDFLFSGYKLDPIATLDSAFDDIANDMVVAKNIEFYSMCEHHFLPFFGHISIGYIPHKKVAGLSNLVKCIEVFARRLQIQERLCAQIADTIMLALKPKGVMVICNATHLCMSMRGVQKNDAKVITSSIRGIFKKDSKTRAEFMQLIN